MASRLLPDALWNEIESLFPLYEPSPEGGRHPKEHRVGAHGDSLRSQDRN